MMANQQANQMNIQGLSALGGIDFANFNFGGGGGGGTFAGGYTGAGPSSVPGGGYHFDMSQGPLTGLGGN